MLLSSPHIAALSVLMPAPKELAAFLHYEPPGCMQLEQEMAAKIHTDC